MDTFEQLPLELHARIARFTPIRTVLSLGQTSRLLLDVYRSADVWRPICRALVDQYGWSPPTDSAAFVIGLGPDDFADRKCRDWGLEPWEHSEHGNGIRGWYQLATRFFFPHLKYLGWNASSLNPKGRLTLITIDPHRACIVAREVTPVNAFDRTEYNQQPLQIFQQNVWAERDRPRLLAELVQHCPPLPLIPAGAPLSTTGDAYQLPHAHESPYRDYSVDIQRPVFHFSARWKIVPWRAGPRLVLAGRDETGPRVELVHVDENVTVIGNHEAEALLESVGSPPRPTYWHGREGGLGLPSLRFSRTGALKSSHDHLAEWSAGDTAVYDVLPPRPLPQVDTKGKGKAVELVPRLEPGYGLGPSIVSNAWAADSYVTSKKDERGSEPREDAVTKQDKHNGSIRYDPSHALETPASSRTERTPHSGDSLFAGVARQGPLGLTMVDDDFFFYQQYPSNTKLRFPIHGPSFPSRPDQIGFPRDGPIPASSLEGSIWIGSYGPHGLEFGTISVTMGELAIHRADEVSLFDVGTSDDRASSSSSAGGRTGRGPGWARTYERCWIVEYVKLTGDQNVPIGAPSWMAKLPVAGPEPELPHVGVDELDGWMNGKGEADWARGVVEGKGHLAFTDYRNPHWTEADVTFVSSASTASSSDASGLLVVDEIRVAWRDLRKVSTFRRFRLPM